MTDVAASTSSAEFWLRRAAFFGAALAALVVGVVNFQGIRIPFAEPIFFAWSVGVLAWAALHIAARPDNRCAAFASAAFAGLPALAVAAESFIPWSALRPDDRAVTRIATAIGVAAFLWLLKRIERRRFAETGSHGPRPFARWARGVLIAFMVMLTLSTLQFHVAIWGAFINKQDFAYSFALGLIGVTVILVATTVGLAFRRRWGVWLSVAVAMFAYGSGLVAFVVVVQDRGWLSFASVALIVLSVFTTFGSGILWLLPRATPSAQTRS